MRISEEKTIPSEVNNQFQGTKMGTCLACSSRTERLVCLEMREQEGKERKQWGQRDTGVRDERGGLVGVGFYSEWDVKPLEGIKQRTDVIWLIDNSNSVLRKNCREAKLVAGSPVRKLWQ